MNTVIVIEFGVTDNIINVLGIINGLDAVKATTLSVVGNQVIAEYTDVQELAQVCYLLGVLEQ